MTSEECIKKLKHTIEQLRSFGYQWSVERADDLDEVIKFVDENFQDNLELLQLSKNHFINFTRGES